MHVYANLSITRTQTKYASCAMLMKIVFLVRIKSPIIAQNVTYRNIVNKNRKMGNAFVKIFILIKMTLANYAQKL